MQRNWRRVPPPAVLLSLFVRVIPWSPIARGLLARPYGEPSLRSETDEFLKVLFSDEMRASEKEIINRVEALAKKRDVSMAQIATAWCLSKDGVVQAARNGMLIISCDCSHCWIEFRKENPGDCRGCQFRIGTRGNRRARGTICDKAYYWTFLIWRLVCG